jgi:hypothetical protein
MDADVNNQCQCELCQPNWYLGRDDLFEVQPVREAQAALEEVLSRKLPADLVWATG